MKINLFNFMIINYILQLSIVLIVALIKGGQNGGQTKLKSYTDKLDICFVLSDSRH